MNAKVLAGIVVVILIIAAGAYYFVGGGSGTGMATSTSDSAHAVTPSSLKELIAQGVSQQCVVNDGDPTSQAQGTVYISGGKVRGDFSAFQAGKTMTTHFIGDDTDMYTWVDGMTNGFKMTMLAAPEGSQSSSAPHGFDTGKKMNYHCSSWSADTSKFTVPTDVTFKDMAAMLQDALPGSTRPSGTPGGSDAM